MEDSEIEKVESKVVDISPKKYVKEKGKVYNEDLPVFLKVLGEMEPKSPIAYEISRALKKANEAVDKLNEDKSRIMAEYLLRDEEGNYVLKEDAAKAISETEGAQATVFSFETEEGLSFNYSSDMIHLLKSEVDLGIKSIDASTKMVKVDGGKDTLINCLSDYFGVHDIEFLEATNILIGLD